MSKFRTVIGFDFGYVRIGVAVGQELTATARPLATLTRQAQQPDWRAIDTFIVQWRPDLLVVEPAAREAKDGAAPRQPEQKGGPGAGADRLAVGDHHADLPRSDRREGDGPGQGRQGRRSQRSGDEAPHPSRRPAARIALPACA